MKQKNGRLPTPVEQIYCLFIVYCDLLLFFMLTVLQGEQKLNQNQFLPSSLNTSITWTTIKYWGIKPRSEPAQMFRIQKLQQPEGNHNPTRPERFWAATPGQEPAVFNNARKFCSSQQQGSWKQTQTVSSSKQLKTEPVCRRSNPVQFTLCVRRCWSRESSDSECKKKNHKNITFPSSCQDELSKNQRTRFTLFRELMIWWSNNLMI